MSSLYDKVYDKAKETVRLVAIYSVGIFWTNVAVVIPLLKEIFINRKDVFTIKDRSEIYPRLYTECSDIGQHGTIYLDEKKEKVIHYVGVGDASKPLVLFVHGFPQFWYTWRHQLRGLQNMDYYLVAVDMRGAGGSYKPHEVQYYDINSLLGDVRQIIQQLSKNGRAACVVGHDWGAIISWQAAAQSWEWDQYHDNDGFIDRLIILDGPHTFLGFQNINERLAETFSCRNLKSLICDPVPTLTRSVETLKPCVDQFLASFYTFIFQLPIPVGEFWFSLRDVGVFDVIFPKGSVTEDDINLYKAVFAAENHAALTGGMNYYRSNALRGFFKQQKERGVPPGIIGIPTLVIWGDKDAFIVGGINLPNLEKFVPHLKIVHLPEASHFIQEEFPDRVNDLIKKFITSQGDFHHLDENTGY